MEAITGYIFRNAHSEIFGGIDKYFSPFISPTVNCGLRNKEMRDIDPANNRVPELVPQLLTNDPEVFIRTADTLAQIGYREVNLNLGCPSKTVTAKNKGSGFLRFPDEIDAFFEKVFDRVGIKVSVKTRAGYREHEELMRMMEIYNRYPICELTIHPRVQSDMYRNSPNMEIFERAYEMSKIPLCYNGDIVTLEDAKKIMSRFDRLNSLMIGRGLLSHPGLAASIRDGRLTTKAELRTFHDRLYSEYRETIDGERNLLFKMKELWGYLANEFYDCSKVKKKILKSQHLSDYEAAVTEMFLGKS